MLHTIALQNHTHPRLAAFSHRASGAALLSPDKDQTEARARPASPRPLCRSPDPAGRDPPGARGAAASRPLQRGAERGQSSLRRRHSRDGAGAPRAAPAQPKGLQRRHRRFSRREGLPGTHPPRALSQRAGGTQQHPPSSEAVAPLGPLRLLPAAPPGPAPLPALLPGSPSGPGPGRAPHSPLHGASAACPASALAASRARRCGCGSGLPVLSAGSSVSS